MKGLLSKKLLAFTLAAAIAIPATPVLAETSKPTSAGIDLTVTTLSDTSNKPLEKSGLNVTVQDGSGNVLTLNTDYTLSPSGGKYSIAGLKKTGVYSITVQEGTAKTYASIKVPITAFSAKAKAAALTWADSNDYSVKKIGAVGGIVTDGTANGVVNDAKLIVKNATVTYTTYSVTNGSFKAYVPAGKYDFIVTAADAASENVAYPITVTAGQTAAPLATLNAKTAKGTNVPADLKLAVTTVKSEDTSVSGTVYAAGYNVSVYSVTYGTYTLLGTGVSKTAKSGSDSAFSVKLLSAQPDKHLVVRVEDKAGNTAEASQDVAKATVTDIKTSPTSPNVGLDLVITFKDAAKLFNKGVTSVTYDAGSGPVPITITDSVYKTAGQIKIPAGSLPQGSVTIKVSATGYNDLTTSALTIGASTKAAPAFTGVKAVAGTAVDTTKITFTNTVSASTVFKAVYGAKAEDVTKKLNDQVPAGAKPIASGDDFPIGENAKYVGLYEVDSTTGQVKKASVVTLTAAQINIPKLGTTASVTGSVITWVASSALDSNSDPVASAFGVTVNGAVYTVSSVDVTGTDVKITLGGAPANGKAVKVKYTAPTSGAALQSTTGNKVANVTTAITVTNNN